MTDRVHVIDSNCLSFQLQQYKNSGMTPHTNKDSSSHDEKVMSETDLRFFSRSKLHLRVSCPLPLLLLLSPFRYQRFFPHISIKNDIRPHIDGFFRKITETYKTAFRTPKKYSNEKGAFFGTQKNHGDLSDYFSNYKKIFG